MALFDEYDEYDAVGLAELVRNGEVSPLELVDTCIARIETRNPKLNAVVHTSFDRARTLAQSDDLPDGPFRGVPFLLKDLYAEDTGQPSTSGSVFLRNWYATQDCELVRRYKASGVIIAGRCNTPEFGIYAVTEPTLWGPTRNPYNPQHTPGGSSGGSAAAVAARMVPMAHGGDGGGSIRIPAAYCGLVGLKPTRARNPIGPFKGEGWAGQTAEHVLTRTVRDTATMLDVTRGPDVGNPYQVRAPERPYAEEVGRDPGKLRIAFTTQPLFADETDPDCARAVLDAAELARSLGHEVEEARPDFDRTLLTRAYLLMVCGGVATSLRRAAHVVGRPFEDGEVELSTQAAALIGEHIPTVDYLWHRQAIHKASRSIGQFFEQYDVFLTPTTARPPARIGQFALSWAEKLQIRALKRAPLKPLLLRAVDEMAQGPLRFTPNTMLFNMTGQPAISLPTSTSHTNLPLGTQWVGKFGDEATLIRLASQIEEASPWSHKRPQL